MKPANKIIEGLMNILGGEVGYEVSWPSPERIAVVDGKHGIVHIRQ